MYLITVGWANTGEWNSLFTENRNAGVYYHDIGRGDHTAERNRQVFNIQASKGRITKIIDEDGNEREFVYRGYRQPVKVGDKTSNHF
jgi:hypothetical protein